MVSWCFPELYLEGIFLHFWVDVQQSQHIGASGRARGRYRRRKSFHVFSPVAWSDAGVGAGAVQQVHLEQAAKVPETRRWSYLNRGLAAMTAIPNPALCSPSNEKDSPGEQGCPVPSVSAWERAGLMPLASGLIQRAPVLFIKLD